MTTNSNDMAFPKTANKDFGDTPEYGLTKREYFAAMCLQGMLSNPDLYKIAAQNVKSDEMSDFYALCATENADSLIKLLNKNT